MDEKVLSFDYSCVPENLKKWCNFEELLFNPTRENLESAKLLFRELYFSFRDVSYHLVIHIGNLFPLKASRISDFFSFLPPTKLRFENSFFTEYLVKKKLLNKTCLLDEIKSKQT